MNRLFFVLVAALVSLQPLSACNVFCDVKDDCSTKNGALAAHPGELCGRSGSSSDGGKSWYWEEDGAFCVCAIEAGKLSGCYSRDG